MKEARRTPTLTQKWVQDIKTGKLILELEIRIVVGLGGE